MNKEEFELSVLEHLTAIADLYNEFEPNAPDHLSMTVLNYFPESNWNDNGKWSTRRVDCNNTFWEREKDKGINFQAFMDIHDVDYYKANGHSENEPAWEIMHLGHQSKDDTERG